MDGLVPVRVSVPQGRLGVFHVMFGRWLLVEGTSEDGVAPGPPGPATRPGPRDEGWRTGARDELLRDAMALYRSLSTGARGVLDYWLDHPGERVHADDLARSVGAKNSNGIAGRLGSFGFNRAKGGGRGLPFHWEPGPKGTFYWMDADVADLFREARQAGR